MTKLSDLEPLKSISVPNIGRLDVRGLTVIAGPNSAGKTRLLRDIQSRFLGDGSPLVVCDNVELAVPDDFDDFVAILEDAGLLHSYMDTNGNPFVRTLNPHIGAGGGGWSVNRNQLIGWNNIRKQPPTGRRFDDHFLRHVGQLLITSLFLDQRLVLANDVDAIDYEEAVPTAELQALYLDEKAQNALSAEIAEIFGKGLWVDATRGKRLCFRVSHTKEMPSAEHRLQPERMKAFRTIVTEGDGLRSYVCVCMSLLLGRRPVQLIDEPEMCLHPPQAYALGRFIGKHASTDSAVFVATHSSHLLRGIVETASQLQVLRLSRSGPHFHGHLMPYPTLKACIDRPSTRAESILDGIFSEATTVVESEGDRLVYSAALHNIGDKIEHDVHFVSVGGIGGLASTARLYRDLHIPQVLVADLDLLLTTDSLRAILTSLTDNTRREELLQQASHLKKNILALGPSLSVTEVKQLLSGLASESLNWDDDDNERVRGQLYQITNKLSRSNRVKHGGIENFREHTHIYHDLKAFVAACRQVGLFLVPVGELEYWEAALMEAGPSRERKAEWANEAALRLRGLGEVVDIVPDGIHDFVNQMTKYHRNAAERIASFR